MLDKGDRERRGARRGQGSAVLVAGRMQAAGGGEGETKRVSSWGESSGTNRVRKNLVPHLRLPVPAQPSTIFEYRYSCSQHHRPHRVEVSWLH